MTYAEEEHRNRFFKGAFRVVRDIGDPLQLFYYHGTPIERIKELSDAAPQGNATLVKFIERKTRELRANARYGEIMLIGGSRGCQVLARCSATTKSRHGL